jgi:hypothetical protein
MSNAGPVRQILRALDISTLRRVRARLAPGVQEYAGQKNEFVTRLRNSIAGSGPDVCERLTNVILEIQDTDYRRPTTRIRDALTNLVVSSNATRKTSKSVREYWICSEAFQALRYEFQDQPFEIRQEESVGQGAADLFLRKENGNANYVIEAKLAGSSGRDRLPAQLRRYEDLVSYRKRTFVLLVVEHKRSLPERKRSVRALIDEVEDRERTEVIVKRPGEIRSG